MNEEEDAVGGTPRADRDHDDVIADAVDDEPDDGPGIPLWIWVLSPVVHAVWLALLGWLFLKTEGRIDDAWRYWGIPCLALGPTVFLIVPPLLHATILSMSLPTARVEAESQDLLSWHTGGATWLRHAAGIYLYSFVAGGALLIAAFFVSLSFDSR